MNKKELDEKLRIKNNLLKNIYKITSLLTKSPDITVILNEIADRVMQGLNFDRAIIMLLNGDRTKLECKCVKGYTPDGEKRAWEKPLILNKHDCYETKVVRNGIPRFIHDTEKADDVTIYDKVINKYQERKSVLYVPLMIKDKILGIVGVDRYRTRMKITQDDVESLTIFANEASIIIENARLYQALSDEKALLDSIIRCSANGVIVSDIMGNIINMNPRAEEILNIPREQALKLRIQEVLNFSNQERLKIYQALKKKEDVHFFDYPYTRSDEKKLFLNLSGFAVLDEIQNTLGAVTIISDLTGKKRMDDYLQRVEKFAALGRIAAGIAHEIRNPLAAIYTTVQNLESELSDNSEAKSDLKNIMQEIDRVESLIREVMNLVRTVPLQVEEFDIHNLITSTLSLLRKEMNKKRITLRTNYNAIPSIIRADPNRLRQVFLNLTINAVECLNDYGKISLETETKSLQEEKAWISIEIADNGVGIAPEHISRIFDPFFTTKKGGTGLGLAVTHKIIEDHNGRIEVESQKGKGTVIRVLLPIAV